MGWNNLSILKHQRCAWSHIKRCTNLSRLQEPHQCEKKKNIWQYVFMSLQNKWVHSIVPGIWPRMLITRILQHRSMYYRMWALKRERKTTTTTTKDNMFIFGNVLNSILYTAVFCRLAQVSWAWKSVNFLNKCFYCAIFIVLFWKLKLSVLTLSENI